MNVFVVLAYVCLIPSLYLFSHVNCHSWAACSQYTSDINGQDYESSSCVGFPRYWGNAYGADTAFGTDIGADYQPGGQDAVDTWCDYEIGSPDDDYSGSYPSAYPMASYNTDSSIRIVWPAKNHANYECFDNVPDNGMKLFYNKNANPTVDPSTLSDWDLAYDWHDYGDGGIDGVPFQNCPDFCDNTDKAVCYGDVVLDSSLFSESGVYTFMWYWAFNQESDIYTTCWEAYVTTDGSGGGTNTDSTDTTVTDTDTTDTTEEDSSDDSNTNKEYLILVPICFIGGSYNELEGIISTATLNLFDNDLEWLTLSLEEFDDEFNVTLQTHTDDSTIVQDITSSVILDNHDFCNEIVDLFGSGECSSCSDVLVYRDTASTSSSNSSNNSDDDSVMSAFAIGMIVVLSIVCVVIAVVIGYYKLRDGKKDSSKREDGMSKNLGQTKTTQAISWVKD